MFLYHYFDIKKGPFLNLSAFGISEAIKIQNEIVQNKIGFAAYRNSGYIERRIELEKIAYNIFTEKGGKPKSKFPHYFVIEECKWLETWYENAGYVKCNIENFDINELSFTYGDLFPTFSDKINDKKEYRKKVYTYDEILKIIDKYGFPQDWNTEGLKGPERYIEAHYWNNNIRKILENCTYKNNS